MTSKVRVVRSLAELREMKAAVKAMAGAKKKLHLPGVPTDIAQPEEAELSELDKTTGGLVSYITRACQSARRSIADAAKYSAFVGDIREDERKIVEMINGLDPRIAPIRRKIVCFYLRTMLEYPRTFPHSSRSLNHIADQGLAIGFLLEANQQTPRFKIVWLPVTVGGRAWKKRPLTTRYLEEEAGTIFSAIQKMAEENWSEYQKQGEANRNPPQPSSPVAAASLPVASIPADVKPPSEFELLKAQANISPEEFFLGKFGKAWMFLNGEWRCNSEKYLNPCFLVERNEEDLVRLAGFPRRFSDLFAEASSDFTDPGENFLNLPGEVGKILRLIKGVISDRDS